VQAWVKELWDYELDARSVKFHVPNGLKDYNTAVTTAVRLRLSNPTKSDEWCATAYKLLPDLLEVSEFADCLDAGFPNGVEDLDSLPRLKRHAPQSKRQIITSVLEQYRKNPASFVYDED
jgi:hypothetical protein